jgi:hypothetical protein
MESIDSSCYLCTCCGVRSIIGEKCMCADIHCRVCFLCVLHCKTPNLHRAAYQNKAVDPKVLITEKDQTFLRELWVKW